MTLVKIKVGWAIGSDAVVHSGEPEDLLIERPRRIHTQIDWPLVAVGETHTIDGYIPITAQTGY